MAEPLLSLRGVHTRIGAYHILQGVDLTVRRGAWKVLLGRNGAGKTTALRTIMGLWKAAQGAISFDGESIGALDTPRIARRGIGYVPEDMGIFATLSVRENMQVAARSGAMDPARVAWILDLFPALKRAWHAPAGILSGGQKQMLSIARALLEPKPLILIDEPTKGLAPAVIDQLIEVFLQLKQGDTTVLLVEQNFHFARSLGEDVSVMDNGRIVHDGSMSGLAADTGLQQRLLGLGLAAHQ